MLVYEFIIIVINVLINVIIIKLMILEVCVFKQY